MHFSNCCPCRGIRHVGSTFPCCMMSCVTMHSCITDDTLHYGEKLRIMANPMVQGEALDASGGSRALCLYSRPVTTTHFAKLSRHQLVAFTDHAGYDSVWQVSSSPYVHHREPDAAPACQAGVGPAAACCYFGIDIDSFSHVLA